MWQLFPSKMWARAKNNYCKVTYIHYSRDCRYQLVDAVRNRYMPAAVVITPPEVAFTPEDSDEICWKRLTGIKIQIKFIITDNFPRVNG